MLMASSRRLTLRRRRVEKVGGPVVVEAGERSGWLRSGVWGGCGCASRLNGALGLSLRRVPALQWPYRVVPAGVGCPGPAAAQRSVAPGALRERPARGLRAEVLSSLGAELSAERRLCGHGVTAGCAACESPE